MVDVLLDFGELENLVEQRGGLAADNAAVRRRLEEQAEALLKLGYSGIMLEDARGRIVAGADALVAGTAVFAGGPARYAENIRVLRA